MSLFEILGTLLIGPLKLLFEMIFSVAWRIVEHPGLAIIVLSLAMNILVLPLYRRADDIQMAARDTENRLKDTVSHIKKTFSGDERMMILQTYYRQNNYSPLSVLSGSLSLLLEIPFFMAAIQFLSGLDALQGISFGPIADLSKPDGLLIIGGTAINVLPLLMTLINVISSALYLKGFPLKTKIQQYGIAAFFLIFLYNYPSALVFYWTLNNTFSLVKTLFFRMKNSKRILNVLLCICGVGFVFFGTQVDGIWRPILVIGIGMAMQLPWMIPFFKKELPFLRKERQPAKPNTAAFLLGALFLTVLVGLLIPSTYISASVQEYIDINYFYAPLWYVVQTSCLAAGTFLVWLGVFYWLAKPGGKVFFTRLVWILSGIMLVNYMFFGTKLGILSPDLQYTDGFGFATAEILINIVVILALIVALFWLCTKFPRVVTGVLLAGCVALAGMSVVNVVQIVKTTNQTKTQLSDSASQIPSFTLSQEGQNVVVIMLDRAIGPFIPYLMEENPTLAEQFDGFTYYENTLAYGPFTNFATPGLHGGYEYTPINMNLRDTERLVDKHNEALKVMPTLFSQEGYDVTLIDPSYANYQWISDLSVFDDIPNVDAYNGYGKFNDIENRIQTINKRRRNFFLFSLMKTLPLSMQRPIYDNGQYHILASASSQTDTSLVSPSFMGYYNVLKNMSTMTKITKGSDNTFLFLRSNATHEPVILQEPNYEPASVVDNSAYYPQKGKTITAGDSSVLLDQEYTISHYHVNMASLMQLGNWFDDLREKGVYDNTRIIIVSDHGRDLGVFDSNDPTLHDTEFYRAMLLVKDFGATGFTTSNTFMTNADVPTLAMEGLIENPVNPFTGKEINSSYKTENKEHYVIASMDWDVNINNGNQFLPAEWASVSGDVSKKENWTFYTTPGVFPVTEATTESTS